MSERGHSLLFAISSPFVSWFPWFLANVQMIICLKCRCESICCYIVCACRCYLSLSCKNPPWNTSFVEKSRFSHTCGIHPLLCNLLAVLLLTTIRILLFSRCTPRASCVECCCAWCGKNKNIPACQVGIEQARTSRVRIFVEKLTDCRFFIT